MLTEEQLQEMKHLVSAAKRIPVTNPWARAYQRDVDGLLFDNARLRRIEEAARLLADHGYAVSLALQAALDGDEEKFKAAVDSWADLSAGEPE